MTNELRINHCCEYGFYINFFIRGSLIWCSCKYSHWVITSRVIANQHNDQLSVGLWAQLVEYCTGIAEVMSSNPVQAWFFFRPYFQYCFSSVHYCEHRFHIQCLWSSDYLSGHGSLGMGLGRLMLYFNGEDGDCPSFFLIYLAHQNFPQLNQIYLLQFYCTTK